jgi:cysteine-rich repeat protein
LYLAFSLVGCGGSPCGDGVIESGEQCDHGDKNGTPGDNCSADCKSVSVPLVSLNVSWGFDLIGNGQAPPGYVAPECSNFGATKADVTLAGPSPLHLVCTCDARSVIVPGGFGPNSQCTSDMPPPPDAGAPPPLPSGAYQATIFLSDASGAMLTKAVASMMINANPGPQTPIVVTFGTSDFVKQNWTGTLDFHAQWGGKGTECDKAMPSPGMESILVVPAGKTQPAAGMTMVKNGFGGTKLDGTPGKCFVSDGLANTYEEIDGLPWGFYKLSVYSQSQPGYCYTQPVFVNPGTINQTYEFVVPYTPPAGMVDAGTMGDGGMSMSDGGASGDGGMSLADGGTDDGGPIDAAMIVSDGGGSDGGGMPMTCP